MDQTLLTAALACLAAGLAAVAVLLLRQRQITARLRQRNDVLAYEMRLREDELRHLVTTRLPALAEVPRDHPVPVPGPLHRRPGRADELEAVLHLAADLVARARTQAEQSATATLRAMMRAVQSLANEQQVAISAMQERHDDPAVLEDLLRIDHMNAQLGRRAQATAVLCGSWPGQQRSASSLTDVVRGATSRIRDYLRVRVTSEVGVAVVSRAVEPVVLALAELLDNAARHSQPSTPVEVNFQQAHNGVAIMIDDAGVAMDGEDLERATRTLGGRRRIDVHALGDPPQVGFAVTGLLAARYGFSVSVDTRSPYGGVRAVVFLPTALLTRVPDEIAPVHTAPEPADRTRTTPGGLVKRRRVSAAPAETSGLSGPAPARPGRPARDVAAGMGAWQRGTRSGRATAPPDSDPPASEGENLRP
ncbi:Histidine kinase-, DNA gyrase B-, and HSP90-like ATPase [Actinomadura rubteroloni]|uniref:histidine kinase n=1 Tax=Actinomadura rubteroloni TaxID=1926885 RepID=A0A2P4UJL7_9ACTN|nr:ATP-binding protein [Actinomadura rubteroloni]POM25245.1 Histidine kinase-, DNA gyrase B-, and HSP90-like ATPase [Actinomadura rubteroloni]